MKINIEYFSQHTNYSCGPVSLKMIFNYLGKYYSENKLIELCSAIPKRGTSHNHLIDEVKREGFNFLEKKNSDIDDIIYFLNKGFPILVNYISPVSKNGHYSIICGYDLNEKYFILADPSIGNDFKLFFDQFRNLWHNRNNSSKGWMLIVSHEKIIF